MHGLIVSVLSPAHDIGEDGLPSSTEAPFVMFSPVSGVVHGVEFGQGFEVRGFLLAHECFDDQCSSNCAYDYLSRPMSNIRRVLGDALGCLVDVPRNFVGVFSNLMDVPGNPMRVPGNLMGVLGNLMDVLGILVCTLLERSLNGC